ncbi:MAG TPA: hypothetical protein VFT46_01005, partial [Holophagaceae bacterium]|nr:hypothetical protein [Holophagaceae bacterium]
MNFRKIALLAVAAALVSPAFAGAKKPAKKKADAPKVEVKKAEKKAVTLQDAPKADAPTAEKKA